LNLASKMDKFSVLICTYNRHELLRRSLVALLDGSTEKPDEIVVVNGGDENADQVVQEFAGRHALVEVRLAKTLNKNLAASRNVGLPYCTGDIIAMTDDDAEVFPDWVTQMKRAHGEHPEAGAVGGRVIGTNSESLLSRLSDQVTFVAYPKPGPVRTLPGVNISYKRRVVDRVGPQDEMLFRGEDVDYNWRIKKLGFEIYYDPGVRVLHNHRPTLFAFLRQHYMYGRAYYLVRRKWREMYCVYPHELRRPRDFLKAMNFVGATFYEPLAYSVRMERMADKVLAYPILLANQIGWRAGMIRQKLEKNESTPQARTVWSEQMKA
jgi:GT2 family glycosyltransferase